MKSVDANPQPTYEDEVDQKSMVPMEPSNLYDSPIPIDGKELEDWILKYKGVAVNLMVLKSSGYKPEAVSRLMNMPKDRVLAIYRKIDPKNTATLPRDLMLKMRHSRWLGMYHKVMDEVEKRDLSDMEDAPLDVLMKFLQMSEGKLRELESAMKKVKEEPSSATMKRRVLNAITEGKEKQDDEGEKRGGDAKSEDGARGMDGHGGGGGGPSEAGEAARDDQDGGEASGDV